jgi:hypothetical protein
MLPVEFLLLGIASHGIINLPGALIGQNVIQARLWIAPKRCRSCSRRAAAFVSPHQGSFMNFGSGLFEKTTNF